MRKKYLKILGLVFSVFGLFLLLNAKIGITGAVIGTAETSSVFSLIVGLVFVFVGVMVFAGKKGGLEYKARADEIRFNEEDAKEIRNKLLKKYKEKEIDETEFAFEINNQIGELTGVVYNPGNNQLTARFMGSPAIGFKGYPLKIEGQGINKKLHKFLCRSIYRKVLQNSPGYKKYCELHFSKDAASKHHAKGLEDI